MSGIHHTAILSSDVEASMRFWRDGLGFAELFDFTWGFQAGFVPSLKLTSVQVLVALALAGNCAFYLAQRNHMTAPPEVPAYAEKAA